MKVKRIPNILLILALSLLSAACPSRTMIGEIEANPSKFDGKKVTIAGTVENSFGVSAPIIKGFRGGAYKVNDGTGEIWVLTNNAVPSKGARVGIKGKIQTGVTINGRNYGLALIEEDRKFANK
ncbi:MAG: hypothetical protein D6687_11790 [Acidobacteria bacterium]|jgi:hypothetical protein|nr:MAG: hypothetical protein D6687_11790 [Acidobacteriota bacterium]GIU82393.1 MAG: hypothetical protein KatS3mg006_1457 [Pyrinomonadaceae bacterium]